MARRNTIYGCSNITCIAANGLDNSVFVLNYTGYSLCMGRDHDGNQQLVMALFLKIS